MSDPVIEVHGVRRTFGDVVALADVDLTVDRGSVLGLLGPNGAGKTTLVRILTTLLAPTAGRATVAGFDVVDDAQALRRVIGLAGQYAAVDEDLTGRENIEMVGRLYHLGKAESRRRADEILERISLSDAADRAAKTYSGGMRRRLDLAASLVGRPEVLFMDEPTTGLDPRSRSEVWHLITELVADGTTLLLTTQYLEEADLLADRIAVIDHGSVIARGTSDELKTQVGGDVLHLRTEDPEDTAKATEILAALGTDDPRVADDRTIAVTVGAGAADLVSTVRQLDDAGIAVADIGLRRPSLDEVFLTLTGTAPADVPADAPTDGARQ